MRRRNNSSEARIYEFGDWGFNFCLRSLIMVHLRTAVYLLYVQLAPQVLVPTPVTGQPNSVDMNPKLQKNSEGSLNETLRIYMQAPE